MGATYCSNCGSETALTVPSGDNRAREVCEACGHIGYRNPRNVVGCIAHWGDSVLMCRRAIDPGYGLWTLPAGYMEVGESLIEGAARELREEACADVEFGPLFAVVDLIHIEEVHFYFTGRMTRPVYDAGDETLEARLTPMDDIPWDQVPFSSVRFALRKLIQDRKDGTVGFHHAVAPVPPKSDSGPHMIRKQPPAGAGTYKRYG